MKTARNPSRAARSRRRRAPARTRSSAPDTARRSAPPPAHQPAAAASRPPCRTPRRRPIWSANSPTPLPTADQPPPAGAEHADHQRDAHRVVRAGLALEQRAGAAGDLAPAEDREHHRRIGRRQRGADDQRGAPVEAEDHVRAHRDPPAVTTVPATPSHDRTGGGAHPRPTDVRAAVEQDDHQGDGDDALVGDDRQPAPRGTARAAAAAMRNSAGGTQTRRAGSSRSRPAARASQQGGDGERHEIVHRAPPSGRVAKHRRPDFPAHRGPRYCAAPCPYSRVMPDHRADVFLDPAEDPRRAGPPWATSGRPSPSSCASSG